MHVDLDTLATALSVRIDDELKACPQLIPWRPKVGIAGYNKRLRRLSTQLAHVAAVLATDTDRWQHPIRIADSTPVPCGTSRETDLRSDLAGWAGYGYCASHSRLFWGLRLHLVTTVHGKGYRDRDTEAWLNDSGITLVRPAYRTEPARPGRGLLRAVRQSIESVNQTFKSQLNLELHGGRSIEGVAARVAQRLLAMTAAIWHNRTTGQPVTRSLIAYDH
ncbi:IS982 family transposase [Micromonospora sp. NPDC050276]|uniref:IS982 family transposase n=1 Tax=Micromonospora sp. NPDC050276 TaxID=3364278 RepID=UPI003789C74C